VETQSLLVPEPVDLGAAEAAAALEHRELLKQLGMQIEPFGGETVLVTGYPAMLANISPAEVLHELLERLLGGGKAPDRRDLLDELLHTIACKAAIKAGDRWSSPARSWTSGLRGARDWGLGIGVHHRGSLNKCDREGKIGASLEGNVPRGRHP
jgi:DNA mismatch repair ATPase MutL